MAIAAATFAFLSVTTGCAFGAMAALSVSCSASAVLIGVWLFCANFFALALAIALATWLLLSSICSTDESACETISSLLPACAFFAFTRANAAATADFSDFAAGVPAFILALRASAAFLCFSSRAIFSRSSLNLRASNLTFAFSALISSNFCCRISAFATR